MGASKWLSIRMNPPIYMRAYNQQVGDIVIEGCKGFFEELSQSVETTHCGISLKSGESVYQVLLPRELAEGLFKVLSAALATTTQGENDNGEE